MRIITISREFGSGGREPGKRLADYLGFDYYDREIITAIAKAQGLDEKYVEKALDNYIWRTIPVTYRHSFANYALTNSAMLRVSQNLVSEQKRVLDAIAKAGKDCIIVGRNADILLKEQNPFSLFVCAEMENKIRRCMERAAEDEHLTHKEIEQNIRRIDRSRAKNREIFDNSRWDSCGTYHLSVNTSGWNIKDLIPVVADFAIRWFECTERA